MQEKERQSVPELSIVMPCRNEEKTVGICVKAARRFLDENEINGEIIVVDNASSDKSEIIAKKNGASIIKEKRIGYGRALRTGINACKGKVIIMGDCDTTYDFSAIWDMYRLLAEEKSDIIIGNRFKGGIKKGAMPLSHKIGVRVLSFLGRMKYKTDIGDFHCGLRGMTKNAAMKMKFHTIGMEFATEMIAEAKRNDLRIMEVPVVLRRCIYDRKSKLRTVRDGFRHLSYIKGGKNKK